MGLVRESDLHWLVGILEGEGTFVAGSPSAPGLPLVRVSMTDRDVVDRVGSILHRSVTPLRPRQDDYKVPYCTSVKGAPAVELMRLVEPLLGERRRGQIARVLATWRPRPARWSSPRVTCTVVDCDRAGARKGLCKRHYNRWWKAQRAGRATAIVPLAPPPYVEASIDTSGRAQRDLWWLAGLLEGEGSFTIAHSDGHDYPVITVKMTDEEVVTRVGSLIGAPSVGRREPAEQHRQPVYVAAIVGHFAAEWMRTVRPYMGMRRTAAIDAALAAYQPIRLVNAPETCVVDGCDEPHRGRGLCHAHYMSWSRDVARGRTPRIRPLR
jgi:hypothetical protein